MIVEGVSFFKFLIRTERGPETTGPTYLSLHDAKQKHGRELASGRGFGFELHWGAVLCP